MLILSETPKLMTETEAQSVSMVKIANKCQHLQSLVQLVWWQAHTLHDSWSESTLHICILYIEGPTPSFGCFACQRVSI